MGSRSANSLTDLLEELDAGTKSDRVELGDIVKAFQYRGFGPLLILPALLIFLTGHIPGVPAACGILMALISLQIVLGRDHPWLPRRLRRISMPRHRLQRAIERMKPLTRKVDLLLSRRMAIFTTKPSQWITGLITLALAMLIIFIGFIPFLPDLLSIPVFVFALGYSARDGLIISLGYLAAVLVMAWLPRMLPAGWLPV